MIQVRKSADRGAANQGWLKSMHTFSFSEYYDPKFMGFGVLRVINEDRIEGGKGFDAHSHSNMEIISYVIQGSLEHKDSMGNQTLIRTGEVQRMTAGTGVEHSEYNHLKNEVTHFLQIWIIPDQQGLPPGYGQKSFETELSQGGLVLVTSKSGKDGSISINQDVNMYVAKGKAGQTLFRSQSKSESKARIWLQVISGSVSVEGTELVSGDGAAITEIKNLNLAWKNGSEFILFEILN